MGGNALRKYGIETDRATTEQLNSIFNRMKTDYGMSFGVEIYAPKCYHEKETHGDLDVLIPKNEFINIKEYITQHYNPRAIYHNSNVYSFDYNNIQVDFILINSDYIEAALTYFSNDPVGNLMGKTYHKFNLSYGWDGLKYKFRSEDGYLVKSIMVSTDIRKIFEFGGFDYDRFLEGFNTKKEIYDFIINGKYFNYKTFLFENLAYKDKKRNRKRQSYNEFLAYVNDNSLQFANHEFHKDKMLYLPSIIEHFPEANLQEQFDELEARMKKEKMIKIKFNGDMVMSWLPELKTGKEIGHVIRNFKDTLGEEYADFIIKSSFMQIHNKFMEIYNEYKHKL